MGLITTSLSPESWKRRIFPRPVDGVDGAAGSVRFEAFYGEIAEHQRPRLTDHHYGESHDLTLEVFLDDLQVRRFRHGQGGAGACPP